MMAAERTRERLIERLPRVRGRLTENAPLAPVTWFRTGGAAELMFRPADVADLAAFLAEKPRDIPVTVIGVASNLLVRDGGIEGVVVRLGRGFVEVTTEGTEIIAGAGALDLNVALGCAMAGIAGLEFMCGIPGTVGGGVRMNAGAYGREFKDVLAAAEALDPVGQLRVMAPGEMGLTYRHCDVPEDWIFIRARFRGEPGAREAIARRMDEIQATREATQPIRARTGGSTFANPPGRRAWELIDQAGCRGLRVGGAMMSEQHANFLINTGSATAAEIEALGEEVRRRVLETTGIALDWEIRRVGRPLPGDAA
jgi:UDP-N-acetylmuramate dehydrogenase